MLFLYILATTSYLYKNLHMSCLYFAGISPGVLPYIGSCPGSLLIYSYHSGYVLVVENVVQGCSYGMKCNILLDWTVLLAEEMFPYLNETKLQTTISWRPTGSFQYRDKVRYRSFIPDVLATTIAILKYDIHAITFPCLVAKDFHYFVWNITTTDYQWHSVWIMKVA